MNSDTGNLSLPAPTSLGSARPPCALQALEAGEIAALQKKLIAYARRALRDTHAAEDVAADTLLALLESPGAFRGDSQLQTYAIGVLKHKIIDRMRGRSRETAEDPSVLELQTDEAVPSPDAALEESQQVDRFWRTLRGALGTLPARLRTAFWLRDVSEWETSALCDHLGVTEGHAHVMLHRARRQLRAQWPAAEAALA